MSSRCSLSRKRRSIGYRLVPGIIYSPTKRHFLVSLYICRILYARSKCAENVSEESTSTKFKASVLPAHSNGQQNTSASALLADVSSPPSSTQRYLRTSITSPKPETNCGKDRSSLPKSVPRTHGEPSSPASCHKSPSSSASRPVGSFSSTPRQEGPLSSRPCHGVPPSSICIIGPHGAPLLPKPRCETHDSSSVTYEEEFPPLPNSNLNRKGGALSTHAAKYYDKPSPSLQ